MALVSLYISVSSFKFLKAVFMNRLKYTTFTFTLQLLQSIASITTLLWSFCLLYVRQKFLMDAAEFSISFAMTS